MSKNKKKQHEKQQKLCTHTLLPHSSLELLRERHGSHYWGWKTLEVPSKAAPQQAGCPRIPGRPPTATALRSSLPPGGAPERRGRVRVLGRGRPRVMAGERASPCRFGRRCVIPSGRRAEGVGTRLPARSSARLRAPAHLSPAGWGGPARPLPSAGSAQAL